MVVDVSYLLNRIGIWYVHYDDESNLGDEIIVIESQY
jgi:hypothetical protein